MTPLWVAAAGGYETAVKLLLDQNASAVSKDKMGLIPLIVGDIGRYESFPKIDEGDPRYAPWFGHCSCRGHLEMDMKR